MLVDFLVSAGRSTVITEVDRGAVEAFMVHELGRGKPSSASVRFKSIQQFFRWCAEEGEIPSSPMAKMSPPTLPEQPVPVISDSEIRSLLRTCSGPSLDDRRDAAMVRVLIDTGCRVAELVGLKVSDVLWDEEVLIVTGKGNRLRSAPIGARTLAAIDRYIRARAQHPRATLDALWLGAPKGKGRGGPMTTSGVRQMLKRCCAEAGMPRLHPHQFRHTFSHN